MRSYTEAEGGAGAQGLQIGGRECRLAVEADDAVKRQVGDIEAAGLP